MSEMMRRLCEAARAGADAEVFQMFEDVQAAVVKALLAEMRELDLATKSAVDDFNCDYSFDNGTDPSFTRQLRVAIDAILNPAS
jgi:hypothetical protein